MMLQKIFKKRSFRRPQKNVDYRSSGGSNRDTGDSDSWDDSSSIGAGSQITPNGYACGPPLALPEGSPINSETESYKKVHFNDPSRATSTSPEKSLSPDCGKKTDVNIDLFDGSVLEAFQTGNLSIADFLNSPLQSPNLDMTKKSHRSMSDFGVSTLSDSSRVPHNGPRKQSLLDRAHSMNSKALRRPPPPNFKTRSIDTFRESKENQLNVTDDNIVCVEKTPPNSHPQQQHQSAENVSRQHKQQKNGFHNRSHLNGNHSDTQNGHHDGNHSNGDTDIGTSYKGMTQSVSSQTQTEPLNDKQRDHKPRFSSSLETLAQEVFGDEFQEYLVGATKSPVKISLARAASDNSSEGLKDGDISRHLSYKEASKMESLHVDVTLGRSGRHLSTSHSFNATQQQQESRKQQQLKKDLSAATSFDVTTMEVVSKKLEQNLESWNNNSDLSTSNSFSNSFDDSRMKPIIEDKVTSPESNDCSSRPTTPSRSPKLQRQGKDTKANIVPITNNQFEFVYRRKLNRLSTSDSQYANVGSFNDGFGDQDTLSQSSVIDINFPPPPPVEEEEFTAVSIADYDAQPYSLPFDEKQRNAVLNVASFDHDSSRFASPPGYRLDFTNDVDPLIESLMSIVPLPEGRDELVPALSKALGEIVSEIIASRRKLKRMMKAIEIHQQVLKDQNRQIQKQNKEIAELRKTAYALNNLHSLPRDDQSFDNSRRTSSDVTTNRQSREMVELNLTLDKLLYQCSTLQKTPRSDSDERLDTNGNSRLAFPGSPNIRRVKSCPSRKLKYTKKAVVEDETMIN